MQFVFAYHQHNNFSPHYRGNNYIFEQHYVIFRFKGIESGPVKTKILTDVKNGDLILEQFPIDSSSEINATTWVKHEGLECQLVLVCTDFFDTSVFVRPGSLKFPATVAPR